MDCDECLEKLYAYLDRELSTADVSTIRSHLDACGDCTNHFFFEESFIRKIHQACAEDRAPEELRERIVLRLREGFVTRERDL